MLCNTLMKHMKHGLETKVAIHLFFLILMHVMLDFVCKQSIQWSIMSYSTLITLRIIRGTMFMLTKLTKMPSYVMLTKPLALKCSSLTILKV
jgi:hypothetical protein